MRLFATRKGTDVPPKRRAGLSARALCALGRPSPRRGQSLVELALVLPLLVLFLSVVIEGGLALNAWIRVNTAARDGARFVLDAGRPTDTATLVRQKLAGIDFGAAHGETNSPNLDIWTISGSTLSDGTIPCGDVDHWEPQLIYDGDGGGATLNASCNFIKTKLNALGVAPSTYFVVVEVDFRYTPILATLISRGSKLPMSSYAIIEQHNNN